MKRRDNGFGTLIYKGEGKNWLAKWVYDGKVYTKSTGEIDKKKALKVLEKLTRPFREESKADVLRNLEAKVKSTEDEIAYNNLKLPGIKLSDLEEKYSNSLNVKDITKSSLGLYCCYINNFVKWLSVNHSNIIEMKDVSKKIVEEYFVEVANTKSIVFFNSSLSLFKKIWNNYKDEGRYTDNPFDNISRRKNEGSKRRELTVEELYKIFEYVKDKEDMLCLFSLGLYTGLRIGDCACLKWNNVDLFRRIISVVPQKTKRYTGQIDIPMHNSLFNVLSVLWTSKGDNEYVIPEIAKSYNNGVLKNRITNIFNKCGVKTSENENGKVKLLCNFHSLRHTFVSMNINSGMSPLLVQNIVGHSSVDMTKHYYHSNEGVIRNGINNMPDMIGCSDYVDMSVKDSDVELLKELFDKDKDKSLSDTVKRLVKYYKIHSKIIDVSESVSEAS
jgi:integrase/recombinase XerD